ncbi:MAG: PEP/pyruvate-binding domain-containing protein [Wenzhouxiangella sp.]
MKGRALIVPFPGTAQANPAQVGGKAASLIRMINAGLSVPPGAVLTTAFFAPWFEAIKASATWRKLLESTPEEWEPLCRALKDSVPSLPLTVTQEDTLEALLRDLDVRSNDVRFAVRSSSPEEDMTAVSFAGVYETRLGVHPDDLEGAVRDCFASSLDVRLLMYKKAHGFDVLSPRIAVIVQRQIASDISGVAFSLNPLTNDYDEAVIEANRGLGTSVVEGLVTPDRFVVDKVTYEVVDESLGAKEVSVWLDTDRGTTQRNEHRSASRTLSDAQLRELTQNLCRIEELHHVPIDIEWAYSNGKLYILQGRPITTFVPLPEEMVTRPGERRRLYADAALSKGLTTNAPLSPMGLDNMKSIFMAVLESWVGPLKRDVAPEDALFFFAGSRMYMNYSNILWLASPKKLARSAAPTDALMAQTLTNIDAKRYRAAKRPAWVSLRLLWLVPRGLWNMRSLFGNLLFALLAPQRAHRAYRRKIDAFECELRAQLDGGLPIDDLRRRYEARMVNEIFGVMMAAVLVGTVSPALVVRPKSKEMSDLVARLGRGATGNVVIEMGIALYRLAGRLDQSDLDDLDRLAERIEQRKLPAEFMAEWERFLSTYGWRGPMEMDLASPRYADDSGLAIRQMSLMAVDDSGFDPESAHQRCIQERQQAYEALLRRLGPVRRALLRRVYRLTDLFAGTRDTPKHLIVLFNYAIRKRALDEGRRLTAEDRLDAAEDIFALRFADLEAAKQDPTLDLRKLCEERTHFRKRLDAHVKSFPAVIDSRGRILRPPATEATPGLLTGMPVSPGVVTGPVKVLHTPHDKAVEKGDILVAYTTDPGWTPLFVNAAAVVLEVGGVLQHGALVAREFGKPCVVGIDQVVSTLKDGELVEVNGTTGTVRRLSLEDTDSNA